ncbi:MAG: SH3 domain-containing protein, partial [Caldilineaceae bacterium]|nr:SH3 domain-containing protein [Caldilineaceae bacterium]
MKRYVTVLLIAVIAGTLLLAGCGRGLVMPLSNLALAQLLIEQVSDASETQANDDTPADLEQGPTAIVLPAPTPNLFTPLKPVDIALPREPKVPPTIVPTPITQTAKIIANTLNFREGPGLGYSVIDTLAHGTKLVIIGVNADCSWLKVHNPESGDEFAGA